jgi:5-methylcytosine-specific restriction endonuclease McrA
MRSMSTSGIEVDWEAVQVYYDAGHTMRECQSHFGFSNGAWDRARLRGALRTRGRGGWRGGHHTRKRVERLLNEGRPNAEVAAILGISTATVSYHARKLGVPPDRRFSKRVDWDAVQAAHDHGMSVRDCARKFGFHKGSWHKAVQRGAIRPRSHVIPIEELLVCGRRTGRDHLKARLVKAGLKQNRCELCGIDSWLGKPLNAQLHHQNGDGSDNRIENIQMLCPNCHSQTDTYGGHRRAEGHLRLVQPPAAEETKGDEDVA